MQVRTTHREIVVYGFSMAAVLLLLKWLEAHFIIFNYRLDIFIGLIAVLFMVLGIWLAFKLVKPKVNTVVIEKEVYRERPTENEINQKEIERLQLSKRELDVLTLMAKGLSNEEIAAELFVSLNTIKTHSSNIYLKLEVKRRTQAVEKAKRLSVIA